MAKRTEQSQLDMWESTLADLERQRAEQMERKVELLADIAKLQEDAKKPRSGGLRISELEELSGQEATTLRTIRVLDSQIQAVKSEVGQARQAANAEKIHALHGAERKQYEKVMVAWRVLVGELDALDDVYKDLGGLGGSRRTGFLPTLTPAVRRQVTTWDRHDPFASYNDW